MKKLIYVSFIAVIGLVGILGIGIASADAASKEAVVKSSTVDVYNGASWRIKTTDYWRTIYYNSYCYRSGQSSVKTDDGWGHKITTTYYYDYK